MYSSRMTAYVWLVYLLSASLLNMRQLFELRQKLKNDRLHKEEEEKLKKDISIVCRESICLSLDIYSPLHSLGYCSEWKSAFCALMSSIISLASYI